MKDKKDSFPGSFFPIEARQFISLDIGGQWLHNGIPVTNQKLVKHFYSLLEIDDKGGYSLKTGGLPLYVKVEDAPFIVTQVECKSGELIITLNDGTGEALNYSSLETNDRNVLYCQVKNGTFRARFSRAAYFQFAEYAGMPEFAEAFGHLYE